MSEKETNQRNAHNCQQKSCPECESFETKPCPPQLSTDCVVVDSLVFSEKVYKVAELSIPVSTLGDIISVGPGGVISPLITLTPDLSGLVSQVTVVNGMVINTGYLPANINVVGLQLPIQINLPFQQETSSPGICPEDTVNESPFKIESVVIQGVEALGVSVANIVFKVVLSTNLTVTRPVITKTPNLQVVRDVNEERCRQDDFNG